MSVRLSHNNTSPITRTHLTIDQLIPNRSLRKAIEDEHAMLRDAAAASSIEFTEKLLAATTRGGGEQEKPALSLSYKLGKTPNTFELLASITPPVDVSNDVRSGCDICCVGKLSCSINFFKILFSRIFSFASILLRIYFSYMIVSILCIYSWCLRQYGWWCFYRGGWKQRTVSSGYYQTYVFFVIFLWNVCLTSITHVPCH